MHRQRLSQAPSSPLNIAAEAWTRDGSLRIRFEDGVELEVARGTRWPVTVVVLAGSEHAPHVERARHRAEAISRLGQWGP